MESFIMVIKKFIWNIAILPIYIFDIFVPMTLLAGNQTLNYSP